MSSERRYRILVVEDEPDVSTYLQMILNDAGYATESAGDGREGIEKARATRPDLVCLDITMPEESGVRMYRNLRGDPALADVPVFIVTAVTGEGGDPEPFRRFISTRASVPPPDAFFPKPLDRAAFLAKVGELLPL
jgi:CheY-like chemotaxis protein